jgi:transposase
MKIVGCDLRAKQHDCHGRHRRGEFIQRTLAHEGNAVREFYAALEGPVVVGIEATGSMQWFLELLEELGIECRVGHPAKIRAAETRKHKHDRRDARLSSGKRQRLGKLKRPRGKPEGRHSGTEDFVKQANATAFRQWRSWLRGGRI